MLFRESGDQVELTIAAKQVLELFYTHHITAVSEENYEHLWNEHSYAFTNDAFSDVVPDQSDRVVEENVCEEEVYIPVGLLLELQYMHACLNITVYFLIRYFIFCLLFT